MFALCGNRTRDLLRSRRVFQPLRHIGRQKRKQILILIAISNVHSKEVLFNIWKSDYFHAGFARMQCWYQSVSLILCMLYTYKISSWITLSIKKNRIPIRTVLLETYGEDSWKQFCFIQCYLDDYYWSDRKHLRYSYGVGDILLKWLTYIHTTHALSPKG
jgi:hypothetical protein